MSAERSLLHADPHFPALRLPVANPRTSYREWAQAGMISVGRAGHVRSGPDEKGLITFAKFASAEEKRRNSNILPHKCIATKVDLTRRFVERGLAQSAEMKAGPRDRAYSAEAL